MHLRQKKFSNTTQIFYLIYVLVLFAKPNLSLKLLQVDITDEDLVEKKELMDSFVDTLLTSINLRDQLDKPVPLLDYALEKVGYRQIVTSMTTSHTQ